MIQFFTDIWEYIKPLIHWGIFVGVIAIGYIFTYMRVGFMKKISTGWKVWIFGGVFTALYAIFEKIAPGVALLSFIGSFGFHGAILSRLEKVFRIGKTVGGELPPDDDEGKRSD
jgi:hypothetical protein